MREWRRGTALAEAPEVFAGEAADVSVSGHAYYDRGERYEMYQRGLTFYTSTKFFRVGGQVVQLAVPDDTEVSTMGDQLLIELREPWKPEGGAWGGGSFKAGSLLACAAAPALRGETPPLACLFEPGKRTSLDGFFTTKGYLVLSVLNNVRSELSFLRHTAGAGFADEGRTFSFPNLASVQAWALEPEESDAMWMIKTGFTEPTQLFVGDAGGGAAPELIKSLPAMFDARGLQVQQLQATSLDGTIIPYFIVAREGVRLDGSNPTLLYGYGGFEISLLPSYISTAGLGWLERGGVYVQANIRGGGEFGPEWHQAALKEKRHKAYEDFEAVGEDLIRRGYTTQAKLGVQGGSNGGLLTGNMLVRRPDLWGAIVCQVPLLDMRRFSRLLAGASWMGEYGNPDVPEEWKFIESISPYHNIKPGAAYPPILFTTSTRDDRVHPAHARKMVARLLSAGASQTLYYENIEGGHGGAADNKQREWGRRGGLPGRCLTAANRRLHEDPRVAVPVESPEQRWSIVVSFFAGRLPAISPEIVMPRGRR